MRKRVSVVRVRSNLGEYLRQVEQGESLVITRRGEPVAVLTPFHPELDEEAGGHANSQAGLASLAGGWEGSEDLVRQLGQSPRMGRRAVPALD